MAHSYRDKTKYTQDSSCNGVLIYRGSDGCQVTIDLNYAPKNIQTGKPTGVKIIDSRHGTITESNGAVVKHLYPSIFKDICKKVTWRIKN
jgi:hypothetical protein